jgi:photosystem II stability/assembly factor-like uncharacterized protein
VVARARVGDDASVMSHRSAHLALALALALAALTLLAACGSTSHPTSPGATPSQPAVTRSTPATSGTGTPATATTPTTATNPPASTGPAGGPIPSGFAPASFTAISDTTFWLLGTAPCHNPVCTSIVRTTDGGAHFVGIPAPPVRVSTDGSTPGIAQLGFADPRDGFAGGNGAPNPTSLWETRDGGAHWRSGLPGVIDFTITAGRIYALTGTCANGACSQLRLNESSATRDAWTSTAIPLSASSGASSLTASGSSVWVQFTPAGRTAAAQTLFVSRDDGRSLVHVPGPCVPGLGGQVEASSPSVVWAVCPTGMLSGAWRSTDGGAHWSRIPPSDQGVEMANSARLAAASDSSVVIATGGTSGAVFSRDGGSHFARVPAAPARGAGDIGWLGFTDARTGSALVFSGGGSEINGVPAMQLWRSSDGGLTWTGPAHIAGS